MTVLRVVQILRLYGKLYSCREVRILSGLCNLNIGTFFRCIYRLIFFAHTAFVNFTVKSLVSALHNPIAAHSDVGIWTIYVIQFHFVHSRSQDVLFTAVCIVSDSI